MIKDCLLLLFKIFIDVVKFHISSHPNFDILCFSKILFSYVFEPSEYNYCSKTVCLSWDPNKDHALQLVGVPEAFFKI